jgi:glycosyltransferase involved in cell wall biosynthesis
MNRFSVLLSVYSKDSPEHLKECLVSLKAQTLQPNDFVVVKDGLLTAELDTVIDDFKKAGEGIQVIQLTENKGLGSALSIGLNYCLNDVVARMDADDIAHPHRFEKQISYLFLNKDVAVVGCNLQEFNDKIGDIQRVKKVPLRYNDIKNYARFRNPLNHPSVVFRKSIIEKVGSYQHMPLFEDYYLWLRILKGGYKLENLGECLLYFRVGNQALTRRHGLEYLKKEMSFFLKCAREQLIPVHFVLFLFFIRFPFRLLPKKLFLNIYQILLRT